MPPVLLALVFAVALFACATPPGAEPVDAGQFPYPIRFLLSFDDGPSIREDFNPTLAILDDMARNPIQPGIKAIFFVQTRAVDGGGTPQGREILQREQVQGHLLAFHTATPRHTNHRSLTPDELDRSLREGSADIASIAGNAPTLVRPPFWNYDQRTFAAYQAQGLHLLLTDLSANDGKIWGINFSLRRRSILRNQLAEVRGRIRAGLLPAVNGEIPVVVTFHDLNTFTARHMQEYLQILLDAARELGLPTAVKPFYDDRNELEQAALARSVRDALQKQRLPGFWNWWWN